MNSSPDSNSSCCQADQGAGPSSEEPARSVGKSPAKTRKITRRRLLMASLAASLTGWSLVKAGPLSAGSASASLDAITPEQARALFEEAVANVVPDAGFRSRIALQDSVLRLVAEGVIDPERFGSVYADRGGMPAELKHRLVWPSHLPIHLTAANAEHYVNLLWPIGLANHMSSNEASPVNGSSLFSFASTAGWNLGGEDNGGVYFNRFRIVELSPEREALVTHVAKSTFRPCCNNSTFFQDCNHGSALFGLLQLGASQGLNEDELFNEALAFNSFWFPQIYMQTAVYFKLFEGRDWAELDPAFLMGARYSALGPWQAAVGSRLAEVPGLLPQQDENVSCGA